MVDFLLELGTEEIPAFYIEPACQGLQDRLIIALEEAHIDVADSRTASTPRRLTLFLAGLPESQPDREEEVSGPPEKAAFDQQGQPTKAATGFARGHGLGVEEIELRETPKGRYCFLQKKIAGRATSEVLAEILPQIIARVHFPKSMRWPVIGAGQDQAITFARPIRSITALLGGAVVAFAINGVAAGRQVFGHPFLAPEPFELATADMQAYLNALQERSVIADVDTRRTLVRDGVDAVLRTHGGTLKTMALVDEVTNLVELPNVVQGTFDERYLELPAEVVKSAMMDHQRYFPVEDSAGRLLSRFITVINRGEQHATAIREGNERVLAARLADAEFFLKEDRKRSLDQRVEDLQGIVFQEKLGTYYDRTRRISELTEHLAARLGLGGEESACASRAARLCKCDLTTEMVGEFPNLQGIIGGEYARMDGEDPEVATAIEEHYLPRFAGDSLPSSPTGRVLALAEKFDAVVGCFAAGLAPTGSQDPYGLRRQALSILRIVLECGLRLSLNDTISFAASRLPEKLSAEGILENRILDFFWDRLYNFCLEHQHRYDLVKATLATSYDDFHDFQRRLEAIEILAKDDGWEDLVTVVQRTFNIYKNAGDPGEVDEELLQAPEERAVFEVLQKNLPIIAPHVERGEFVEASRAYAKAFVEPVHDFFDKVFVNVDDAAVKNNRMALMKAVNQLYSKKIADLSHVVLE